MAVMRVIDHISDMTTTVSTGASNFCSFTPPNGTVGQVLATVVGKDGAATPNICSRALATRYRKTGAGVLTSPGAVQTLSQFTDLALLTTDATIIVSGGAILIRATGGLLGTNLEWWADMWISYS